VAAIFGAKVPGAGILLWVLPAALFHYRFNSQIISTFLG
jgi:hypothetical protein